MKRIILAICLTVLVAVGVSSAATMTQTATFSGTAGDTMSLSLARFNPGVGTLERVYWQSHMYGNGGTFILDWDGSEVWTGSHFRFGATAQLSSLDVPLDSYPIYITAAAWETVGSDGHYINLDDGDGSAFSPYGDDALVYAGQYESSSIYQKDLYYSPAYIGLSPFNLSVNTWVDWAYDGYLAPYSTWPMQHSEAAPAIDGYFTVIYTYTPVPEPATMVLLGLGALGLLKKRRA